MSDDNDEMKQMTLDGGVTRQEESESNQKVDDAGNEIDKNTCKTGVNRYLVISDLQKAIRRGDTERAAFRAWDLVRSGFGWHCQRRLKIIANELFKPGSEVVGAVSTYVDLAFDFKTKKEGFNEENSRWALMNAAWVMADGSCPSGENQKGRIINWFDLKLRSIAHQYDDLGPWDKHFEIADESYDMHTRAGKAQGRNFAHFVIHSSRTDSIPPEEAELKDWVLTHSNDSWVGDPTEKQRQTATTPTDTGETDDYQNDDFMDSA